MTLAILKGFNIPKKLLLLLKIIIISNNDYDNNNNNNNSQVATFQFKSCSVCGPSFLHSGKHEKPSD